MAATAKRKKSPSEKRLEAVLRSGCTLKVGRDDQGALSFVRIELRGEAAQFPSAANSMKAFVPRGWGHAIVTKSDRAKHMIKVITEVFAQELVLSCQGVPEFGDTPVHVLIALANSKRPSDSHNYSKSVCDWLQDMGIVSDDIHSEAFAVRKSDYPMIFPEISSTHVVVIRREFSQVHYSQAIGAIIGQES